MNFLQSKKISKEELNKWLYDSNNDSEYREVAGDVDKDNRI